MANINSYVNDQASAAFKKMLEEGHFPEVNYKKDERGFTSYYLMEYMQRFATFRTIIHDQLQAYGFAQGIFATRLRSKQFKGTVDEIIRRITPETVLGQRSRLRTWAD